MTTSTKYCFLDGELLAEDSAKISCLNKGFLAGIGIYETLRTINQIPFNWDQHYQRLKFSAQKVNLTLDYQSPDLLSVVSQVVNKNQHPEQRIRITLTASDIQAKSTLLIQTEPLLLPDPLAYKQGVDVVIAFGQRPCPTIKSTNLITQTILSNQFINENIFEVIMTNQNNELLEGTKTNCFVILDQKVYTPPKQSILYGTTADLLKIILPSNLHPQEKSISLEQLPQAEEMFLTNTVIGVLPIKKINNIALPVGKITIQAITAYNKYLAQQK